LFLDHEHQVVAHLALAVLRPEAAVEHHAVLLLHVRHVEEDADCDGDVRDLQPLRAKRLENLDLRADGQRRHVNLRAVLLALDGHVVAELLVLHLRRVEAPDEQLLVGAAHAREAERPVREAIKPTQRERVQQLHLRLHGKRRRRDGQVARVAVVVLAAALVRRPNRARIRVHRAAVVPTLAPCEPRVVVRAPLVAVAAVATRAGIPLTAPAGRARGGDMLDALHNLPALARGRLFDNPHLCKAVGPVPGDGAEHFVPALAPGEFDKHLGCLVIVHAERLCELCHLRVSVGYPRFASRALVRLECP